MIGRDDCVGEAAAGDAGSSDGELVGIDESDGVAASVTDVVGALVEEALHAVRTIAQASVAATGRLSFISFFYP